MLRLLRRLVLLAVLVAVAWVASVPVRIWWDARQEDRRPSDVVLVLGAAQYNGQPSAVFQARLRKAQSLYEAGVAPAIVTVGAGAQGDATTEAEAGRAWLLRAGVPAGDVVAVPEGTDTQTSLAAAAGAFAGRGWRTAVIVTDPWHTFRSTALATAAGLDAVAAPARSGPAVRTRETQVRYILRESAAYIAWRLTGGALGGGPAAI